MADGRTTNEIRDNQALKDLRRAWRPDLFPDTRQDEFAVVTVLPDMAPDDPRLPAVLKLYNAGILTGVDAAGSFAPDAVIPREQVAAMATRVADPALRRAFAL